MTTDTRPKIVSERQTIAGRDVTLLGMAKGAAMIGPRMATMLGFLLTDAPLRAYDLQRDPRRRRRAVVQLPLGRGARQHQRHGPPALEHRRPTSRALRGEDVAAFAAMVRAACESLARQIADDGEGATHFITIDVEGCDDRRDARTIARAVADSPLVKTAIHGADPNWGRIVSAAGYAGVAVRGGRALPLDQRRARLPAGRARRVR